MKKILFTVVMAAVGMTALAQNHATSTTPAKTYYRVEFTVPIVGGNTGSNTSVAATMKDLYIYCNPEHQYLDFQADNGLWFRTTTTNVTENSSFYIENGRTAQGGATATYPYLVDKIKKISSYSQPVQKVTLKDSTTTKEFTFVGDGKKYKGATFTFDRLPRNVAELKTLIENPDGSRVEACKNPLFMAAVGYLVWPALLNCSQDCRDMVNYLYGTHYSQLNTIGISNTDFQNLCIGWFTDNGGKDLGGGWLHNNLFQHFAGASPGNMYKPNGNNYWTGPYKVRVAWDTVSPTSQSAQLNCTIASILLFPNPDATSKSDISFESPNAHNVKLRSTNKNGWFLYDNHKSYYSKGKQQRDDDF